MSDDQIEIDPDTDDTNEEVSCLLVPLLNTRLLLPASAVAEMAAMKPLIPVDRMPSWMLGFYDWREVRVPVISYEVINGVSGAPLHPQGRMAVINNTGVDPRLPFIAIPTQGIPRMSRVSIHDISENPNVVRRSFDKMRVRIGMEEFVIPDIAAIEQAYLNTGRLDG